MAKPSNRTENKPKRKKILKRAQRPAGAIRTSLALRSSVALARATSYFVSLHDRIQVYVLGVFQSESNDVSLDKPLPLPLSSNEAVMEEMVDEFKEKIQNDSSWGIDPDRFNLTGKELLNQTKGMKVSGIVQFFFQRAHDALA